jgi:hypothetical protein
MHDFATTDVGSTTHSESCVEPTVQTGKLPSVASVSVGSSVVTNMVGLVMRSIGQI